MKSVNNLDGQRYFLVVSANADRRIQIANAIGLHIERTHFTFAADGSEAISKIQNFQPHVVVTDEVMPRLSGTRVIEWTMKNAKDPIACILLAPVPDDEQFVDDVVIGRVQFIENFNSGQAFAKTLSRALNCLSSHSVQEFSLKFLAPGDVLVKTGDRAECVYILKHGRLQATVAVDNKVIVLGHVEVGEFVGEMAYINGEARSADVKAVADCELIEIPIDMMDHLLFLKPAWSKALMKTLSRRIKQSNAAMAKT